MKYLSSAFAFFVFCCILVSTIGCNNDDTFISQSEMEDILYDYHIADAMAREAKGGYDKNSLVYRAAVLKKYGVTQAKFDTSMVYYMRHTDVLHKMYENIAERMEEEARNLGADASGGSLTAMGDSADVWKGPTSMVLIPNQPYNLYTFDFRTDTTFHKGDHILLAFKSDFIFQDGMRDGIAVLAVVFNNDSVASRTSHLSSSMPMTLQIDDNDSLGIRQVKGFFMLSKNNDSNSSSTTLQLMSISNIQLLRIHSKQQPQKPLPSQIPVNSTVPDSERMRPAVER